MKTKLLLLLAALAFVSACQSPQQPAAPKHYQPNTNAPNWNLPDVEYSALRN